MHLYYVFWTYIANYGQQEIRAESAEAACYEIVKMFSDDFAQRGRVYVFDNPPSYIRNPARLTVKAGVATVS